MNRSECNLSLDELLKFDGVMAAGIFSPEGKLVDYKSKAGMPKEMAQMTAKFCGAVNMMFDALASAYTELYKMNWVPTQFQNPVMKISITPLHKIYNYILI